ncbi:hypothetical protein [Halapricum hydrolyticum]|uniref:Uncharacterized protein n=1 Tax=Halapricum hydrolyticum TaxID=2979991 RepID=A0AAE3IAB9_9EURY|nr:hypothetical protein [Halapricum hydrolyticum]MCU4718164.1 hypothetical protein [Halapricum hydrolyticum]MCU4726416.1 hypothetical protein [Halapricum hydrolyticum]
MSKNRDEKGQFTEQVTLADVLEVFETVDGPVVTSGDVATVTGCSRDSARRKLDRLHDQGRVGRRKTSGRIVYWRREDADPNPVDPDDPIFVDRPVISSGRENLSEQVDDLLYGADS